MPKKSIFYTGPEAKAFMVHLRELSKIIRKGRRAGKQLTRGSGIAITSAIKPYLNLVGKWKDRIISDRASQKDEIKRLKEEIEKRKAAKLSGGKFDARRDIVDFLAGPAGWAVMGLRKKREREIANLQKELASLGGGSKISPFMQYLRTHKIKKNK